MQDILLTPREAARRTGYSVRSLARLANEGRIRAVRPGRYRRYPQSEIERLLEGDSE